MTKQKEKKKASIVKKMMIAVVAGFVVGFICLLIKSAVMGTDGEGAWKVVEAIFIPGYHRNKRYRRTRLVLHRRSAVYEGTSDDDCSSRSLFADTCTLQPCKSEKARSNRR
mgnify:CR=1 FL=1